MSRVCLDNHILIWGIRGVATSGQEGMIQRALDLLGDLEENDADILIPSVVASEFLAGVAKTQHTELLRVLNLRFQLPPFDVRSAAMAAEIWRDAAELNPNLREQIRENFPGTERAKIKADIQIVATALVHRADILYTHDGVLRSIATGRIDVRELPPPRPVQSALF
jgi:predicted nucleic acid-binding protein